MGKSRNYPKGKQLPWPFPLLHMALSRGARLTVTIPVSPSCEGSLCPASHAAPFTARPPLLRGSAPIALPARPHRRARPGPAPPAEAGKGPPRPAPRSLPLPPLRLSQPPPPCNNKPPLGFRKRRVLPQPGGSAGGDGGGSPRLERVWGRPALPAGPPRLETLSTE